MKLIDESWLDAEGVFETLRTYQNAPFGFALHLERMNRGINELKIPAPSDVEIEGKVNEYLANHPQDSGHLRIVIDRFGNLSISHNSLKPISNILKANIVDHRSIKGVLYKSTNYRERLQLRAAAMNAGFDDSIISDGGQIVESTTCNLIYLSDGEWFTPPLATGCLPGVTRQLLMENFGLQEKLLLASELEKVEALAMISSLREIEKIQEVNGKVFPHSHSLERLQIEFHAWILGNLAL